MATAYTFQVPAGTHRRIRSRPLQVWAVPATLWRRVTALADSAGAKSATHTWLTPVSSSRARAVTWTKCRRLTSTAWGRIANADSTGGVASVTLEVTWTRWMPGTAVRVREFSPP